MTSHAKEFPPSGADRWMLCTASVPLISRLIDLGELRESDLEGEERITEDDILEYNPGNYDDTVLAPDDGDSFAAEGTVMHTVRQLCLQMGTDPLEYSGIRMSEGKFTFDLDDHMLDRLVEGIDWIRGHTATPDVEIRVGLDPWLEGAFGTCDTAWYADKTLYISDYKNGIGKPVPAVKNRQLRIYALGYWHMIGRPPVKKVVINIDQPRAGGMKFWDVEFDELIQFGEELRRVQERVRSGDVEFVPTKSGCQFCPVRKSTRGCAAYNQWCLLMLGTAMLDPNDTEPSFKNPAQMSRAQRWYVVQHSATIKAWLGKLYAESLAAALAGEPDPGSKVVDGDQGNRFFTDAAAAEQIVAGALGLEAYAPPKMIGITEIEKRLKPGKRKQGYPEAWDALLELVDRPAGKPKLVPEDHPKEAIKPHDYADEFDDL